MQHFNGVMISNNCSLDYLSISAELHLLTNMILVLNIILLVKYYKSGVKGASVN